MSQGGAGMPDHWARLWAPHRLEYLKGENRPLGDNEVACPFCRMKTLRKVSNPAGFNLGMNQGAISGAGVADHIHQHVVPRWAGDANFMPIIGQTKTLPQLLSQTRDELASAW